MLIRHCEEERRSNLLLFCLKTAVAMNNPETGEKGTIFCLENEEAETTSFQKILLPLSFAVSFN